MLETSRMQHLWKIVLNGGQRGLNDGFLCSLLCAVRALQFRSSSSQFVLLYFTPD